jgi:hypothetical protein
MRPVAAEHSTHTGRLRVLPGGARRAGHVPGGATAIAGNARRGRIGTVAREPTPMAFGSTRRVARATLPDETRSRRWIAAVVWGVCLVACVAFWAGVGVALWLIVG